MVYFLRDTRAETLIFQTPQELNVSTGKEEALED